MNEKSGWTVDVKSCSHDQLVELLRQLTGSGHQDVQLVIQRELIERTRKAGLSTQQIVDLLIRGVGRRTQRDEIAKEWSKALGISESEFKRLASGRKTSGR